MSSGRVNRTGFPGGDVVWFLRRERGDEFRLPRRPREDRRCGFDARGAGRSHAGQADDRGCLRRSALRHVWQGQDVDYHPIAGRCQRRREAHRSGRLDGGSSEPRVGIGIDAPAPARPDGEDIAARDDRDRGRVDVDQAALRIDQAGGPHLPSRRHFQERRRDLSGSTNDWSRPSVSASSRVASCADQDGRPSTFMPLSHQHCSAGAVLKKKQFCEQDHIAVDRLADDVEAAKLTPRVVGSVPP